MREVNKLKVARLKAGLTQLELANKLCLKERVITMYETNRATPTIERMVDLARALQTDPSEIWPEAFAAPLKKEG